VPSPIFGSTRRSLSTTLPSQVWQVSSISFIDSTLKGVVHDNAPKHRRSVLNCQADAHHPSIILRRSCSAVVSTFNWEKLAHHSTACRPATLIDLFQRIFRFAFLFFLLFLFERLSSRRRLVSRHSAAAVSPPLPLGSLVDLAVSFLARELVS